MSENYHTPYEDGLTEYKAEDMNYPLGQLDTKITSLNNDFSAYIIACFWPYRPLASQVIMSHQFTDVEAIFYTDLDHSQASSIESATAETVFTLNKNDGAIGTVTWGAAESDGVFSFAADVEFEEGDVFDIVAPASQDATLAKIRFSIKGFKSAMITTTSTTSTSTSTTTTTSTTSTSSSTSTSSTTTTTTSTTTTTTAP